MAEIRVERKKKGIPLIYILLALIALAVIAWLLLDNEDEGTVETAPAVSMIETLTPSIPLSHTHSPLPGEGEEMQGVSVRAA